MRGRSMKKRMDANNNRATWDSTVALIHIHSYYYLKRNWDSNRIWEYPITIWPTEINLEHITKESPWSKHTKAIIGTGCACQFKKTKISSPSKGLWCTIEIKNSSRHLQGVNCWCFKRMPFQKCNGHISSQMKQNYFYLFATFIHENSFPAGLVP